MPTSDSSDDFSDDVDVAAMRTSMIWTEFSAVWQRSWTRRQKTILSILRGYCRQSYLNHFLAADEETSRQPISNFEISSHPLFSYLIRDALTPHPKNLTKLPPALAGTDRVMPASHSQKVSLFKLQAIQRAWQSNQPFQNKYLSLATLSIVDNVLKRQPETLLLAIEAYFLKELAKFPETLKRLCEKYIRLGGDFDAAGFTKALTKQGIYAVNADHMTERVKNVWKDLRLKSLDLPPMAAIGRVCGLGASQVRERLFNQINKAVLEDPEE